MYGIGWDTNYGDKRGPVGGLCQEEALPERRPRKELWKHHRLVFRQTIPTH